MREDRDSLTPAMLELLEACARENTTNAKALANALSRSPETVRTLFKQICQRLNVHSRPEAVMLALKRGWIALEERFPDSGSEPPTHE